jgi:hypothetical protein
VDLILLVARVLLALVFVVAGLAKLADRVGSRQALRDFGVPAALATPLRTLLPRWAGPRLPVTRPWPPSRPLSCGKGQARPAPVPWAGWGP